MDFDFVVDHVKNEVGVERRAHAERAVAEFLEVLSEALDDEGAEALAARLPAEIRPVLGELHRRRGEMDLDALVEHLSEHMQLDAAVTRRVAEAAATALAIELDDAARTMLAERVHPTIAALFAKPVVPARA